MQNYFVKAKDLGRHVSIFDKDSKVVGVFDISACRLFFGVK